MDCTRFGINASRSSTLMPPTALISPAVTARLSRVCPTTMAPRRRSRSARSSARQKIAMVSVATVMSKPSSRGYPLFEPPSEFTMERSARSLMSTARRNEMRRVSRSSPLPQKMWLSSIAASRLLADVMAWKSPVKCRLMSSIGTICEKPPPHAPPLMPKHGPSEGSRRHATERLPMRIIASLRPMVVLVFPTPFAVGVMAVTRMSLPCGLPASPSMKSKDSFAL